ncbi:AP-3 complex subunit beta [Puccinia graminis f. sp. tritici]|uniref:AP-3 complex subunit beta n=1 Tax=Puccinia graminis f. sp. tritici TaxID=56615 RepID=A0A5B0PWW7_PUCGR|nr:AP-3 complex subunit beta [Puccinia graminis f. sp. tritici]KAA1105381.1 AP-3 complex subunit beta [Puccinia graminis f. sp. tritici]
MDLSTLANHAQRLSARLSENLAERTKDLGLDPEYNLSNPSNTLNNKLPILAHAQGLLGNALPYWERLSELTSVEGELETKRLLGSKSESERVEGLKRVTVIMCRNRPVLSFFPFVTNCLHPSTSSMANGSYHSTVSHSFTIRHLVSIYILQHSHLSPDLALLSVNAWQKDLSDPSPIIRSLALKTLAGMGLESVLPLVVVTIDRLANDPNWFVKRTVAEALITVHQMDPHTYRDKLIEGPVKRLLQDRSPLVLGAALTAWEAICPEKWDLLHRRFRAFCWTLVDADENGQHVIMRTLTRYVREHFTNPEQPTDSKTPLDLDLELFLNSAHTLFQSRSSAVVIAATNVFIFLAPLDRLKTVVPDLMRLVEEKASEREDESLLVVLNQIYQIIKFTSNKLNQSHLFSAHLNSFGICSTSDSQAVKISKLKILRTFISLNDRPIQLRVLSELKFCTRDFHDEFVKQVIRTIGRIVMMTNGKVQQEALDVLIELTKTGQNKQRCKSVEILRGILSSDLKTIAAMLPSLQKVKGDLISLLVHNKIQQDSARANLYRLVSDIDFRSEAPISPSFIHFYKYSIWNFANEGLRCKFQILSLVSKSLLMITIRRQEDDASMSSVLFDQRRAYQLGFDHLMRVARYDSNFIVRDRARFLQGLLTSTQGLTLHDEPKGFGLVEVHEHDEHHEGAIALLDEHTAFTRGHQLSSLHDPSPCPIDQESMKKISPNELKKILLLDPSPEPVNLDDYQGQSHFEANSLFRMAGLSPGERGDGNSSSWRYLDWNTVPAWSHTALDPRLREPEDGQEKAQNSSAQLSSAFHQDPSNPSRTSTTDGKRMIDRSKLKEKVVLIPTGSDDDLISTNTRPSGTGGSGHRNLEDFLQSSGDEDDGLQDEDEDESEDESEDEDEDEDEDESESENDDTHNHINGP